MKSFKKSNVIYLRGEDIQPCWYPKIIVEKLANDVIEATNFKASDDIKNMVEKYFKGRIHHSTLHNWTEMDSIYVHGQGDFDIVTESMAIEERQRFTISHELGHFLLHSKWGNIPIIANRFGSGRLEWEANWFAAALLMPKKEFLREAGKDASEIHLSNYFKVSISAISVRKEQLKID